MPKILLTLNTDSIPEGMHPSQLFYSQAHFDEWLKSVADKIKTPSSDGTTLKFRFAADDAEGAAKRTGKIEQKPDDFMNA